MSVELEQLQELIGRACLEIRTIDGAFLGTGYFITATLVASAAHVLRDRVTGRYLPRVAGRCGDTVFSLRHLSGRWTKVLDLAILRVEGPHVADIALPIATGESSRGEAKCVAIGFSDLLTAVSDEQIGDARGPVTRTPAMVAIVGRPAVGGSADERQPWEYKFVGDEVACGMSGGPLVDPDTGLVLGTLRLSRGLSSGTAIPWRFAKSRLNGRLRDELSRARYEEWWAEYCRICRCIGASGIRRPMYRRLQGTPDLVTESWYDPRLALRSRTNEMASLRSFLCSPEPFQWMTVSGPGGIGKSRLALELALQSYGEWECGLIQASDVARVALFNWRPLRSTLLLLDDVAAAGEQVGDMLRQAVAACAKMPTIRVRIIVTVREVSAKFLKELGGGAGSLRSIRDYERPGLELTGLAPTALGDIASELLGDSNCTRVTRQYLVDNIDRIDSTGRPIIAVLVARAVARGVELSGALQADLFESYFAYEEAHTWRTAGVEFEDLALAFYATLNGGIVLRDAYAEEIAQTFPERSNYSEAKVRSITGHNSGDVVAPVSPEIFGSAFVLRCLRNVDDSLQRERLQALIAYTWRVHFRQMTKFSQATGEDFIWDSAIPLFALSESPKFDFDEDNHGNGHASRFMWLGQWLHIIKWWVEHDNIKSAEDSLAALFVESESWPCRSRMELGILLALAEEVGIGVLRAGRFEGALRLWRKIVWHNHHLSSIFSNAPIGLGVNLARAALDQRDTEVLGEIGAHLMVLGAHGELLDVNSVRGIEAACAIVMEGMSGEIYWSAELMSVLLWSAVNEPLFRVTSLPRIGEERLDVFALRHLTLHLNQCDANEELVRILREWLPMALTWPPLSQMELAVVSLATIAISGLQESVESELKEGMVALVNRSADIVESEEYRSALAEMTESMLRMLSS